MLVALGEAIGAGCHPCIQHHTQAALKAGLDAVEVRWAIEMAQVVRARGGVAVANVGRRILGVDQQELVAQGAPPCQGSALVWLGAAAGCNSGVLLAEHAPQAAALGVGAAELREAIDVAEMVKSMAALFYTDSPSSLGRQRRRCPTCSYTDAHLHYLTSPCACWSKRGRLRATRPKAITPPARMPRVTANSIQLGK